MDRFDDLENVKAVDDAMRADWQQGDVITGAPFLHLGDPGQPGTPTAQAHTDEGVGPGPRGLLTEVEGLVVISQTCDIVAKTMLEAPFIDCAVLVDLPNNLAKAARAGDRPRYAHLPQLGDTWFADLDQIVTCEKAMLVGTPHDPGVGDVLEQDAFGNAIGRKFARFAFPDDVHNTLSDLQARFKSRHDKEASPEGIVLRRVAQIRAEGDWDSDAIDVRLIFILPAGSLHRPPKDEEPAPPSRGIEKWFNDTVRQPADMAAVLAKVDRPEDVAWLWDKLVESWAASCEKVGKVVSVCADATCADEMTVSEYWDTQRLDLDYLSGPTPLE